MLQSLKITVILMTIIFRAKSHEGETDLTYGVETRNSQVSNWKSPRNYRGPGSMLLEKSHICSSSSDCPPWFICHNGTECQCGPTYQNAIICNETMMISAVVECYCIIEIDSTTYAGYCFYNCGRQTTKGQHKDIYHIISNKKDMTKYM
jgi:hypothetical protein